MGRNQAPNGLLAVSTGSEKMLVGHREGTVQGTTPMDTEFDHTIDQPLPERPECRGLLLRHAEPLPSRAQPGIVARSPTWCQTGRRAAR
jgi:hypothetical protein